MWNLGTATADNHAVHLEQITFTKHPSFQVQEQHCSSRQSNRNSSAPSQQHHRNIFCDFMILTIFPWAAWQKDWDITGGWHFVKNYQAFPVETLNTGLCK